MATLPPWVFEQHLPRFVSRDPVEAEFFHGAGADEEAFERTDALIRESLQNSLDARADAKVRVTFRLVRGDGALEGATRRKYLNGLVDHLDSLKNEYVNGTKSPPLDYLVIEDFGTRGLEGDLDLTVDPESRDTRQDFYWFWRNVGRSGKGGTDRGRWGLGKTVFQASSRINTVFGLTVRASDRRRLLMGQAVTKKHVIKRVTYMPEGFFCDPSRSHDEPQMPFEAPDVLDAFRQDFGLSRLHEPGLSLVVAYPFATLDIDSLMRSTIAHFFLPIMKNELEVAFLGPGPEVTVLDCDSIRRVAATVDWEVGNRSGAHKPPFDLTQWAIERQKQGIPGLLDPHGGRAPNWGETLFAPDLLESSRAAFRSGERLALRVPLTLMGKDGKLMPTYFDAFFEADESLAHGEDCYVRAGMTISGMALLRRHRGWRGLLVVEEPSLSSLLGDTEGPAHLEWRERPGDGRADRNWDKWSKRVGFVKRSLGALLDILNPPPAEVMEDLLADVFGLEDPRDVGRKKTRAKKRSGSEPPPLPPLPPPPQPRPRIDRSPGGFSIAGIEPWPEDLAGLRVRIAYDVSDGNPLQQWDPFDFRLEPKARDVKIECSGSEVLVCAGNLLEVRVQPGFRIDVSGFNPVNDLYIKVDMITDASALESGEPAKEEDIA